MKGRRSLTKKKSISANLFANIPNDLLLSIFSYLNSDELHSISLVCQNWVKLSKIVRYNIEQQKQLEILDGSELWKYLPAIAERGDMLECCQNYLECYQDYPTYHNSENSLPLNVVCEGFQTTLFKSTSNPYARKAHEDYLSKQANFILNIVNQHNPRSDKKPHETLKDFLNFPIAYQKSQHSVFNACLDIESIFATLRMGIQLSSVCDYEASPGKDSTNIICNPFYNKWLTGEGLVFINDCIYQFIPRLLKKAAKLQLKPNNEQPSIEKERLKKIDGILNRLTSIDWLTSLEIDEKDVFHPQTNSLLQAIKANHPLISQLDENVLLKMSEFELDNKQKILEHPILVNKLSDHSLINMTNELSSNAFKQVLQVNQAFLNRFDFELAKKMLETAVYLHAARILLTREKFLSKLKTSQITEIVSFMLTKKFKKLLKNPLFLKKLNFNLAKSLMKKNPFVDTAKILLMETNLISKLKINQIPEMVSFLEPANFDEFLNSQVFLSLLKRLNKPNSYKESNRLIVSLAGMKISFAGVIIENDSITSLLEVEDILKIISINPPVFGSCILNNKNVIIKFTSNQLLQLNHYPLYIGVAKNYLYKLNDKDLEAFIELYQNDQNFIKDNPDTWREVMFQAEKRGLIEKKSQIQPEILTGCNLKKTKTRPQIDLKNGLKIAGLSLLVIIGIGLIATGSGAFFGIPILFQILLIIPGLFCFLSPIGFLINDILKCPKSQNTTPKPSNSETTIRRTLSKTSISKNEKTSPSIIATLPLNSISVPKPSQPPKDSHSLPLTPWSRL